MSQLPSGSPGPADEPAASGDTTVIRAKAPEERDAVARSEEATPEEATPKGKSPRAKKKGSFWKELPVLIILAFVLALIIKTFLVQAFYIPSVSMAPTLEPGDRVLVNKVVYHLHQPRRGDIIVFENPHPAPQQHRNFIVGVFDWVFRGLGFAQSPDEDYIKRVIGLPGETIEGREGHVYINGQQLVEPYLKDVKTGDFSPVKIPEDEYFVMGDNRGDSNDSRYGLGTIPADRIVGRAFVVIWPPSRWKAL